MTAERYLSGFQNPFSLETGTRRRSLKGSKNAKQSENQSPFQRLSIESTTKLFDLIIQDIKKYTICPCCGHTKNIEKGQDQETLSNLPAVTTTTWVSHQNDTQIHYYQSSTMNFIWSKSWNPTTSSLILQVEDSAKPTRLSLDIPRGAHLGEENGIIKISYLQRD